MSAVDSGLTDAGRDLYPPPHPVMPALGWARFETLTRGHPLPVYALGGMKPKLLDEAIQHGAHDIALSSGIW